MADFLVNGAVTNALNMASVTAEEAPILRPYMGLGRKLGAFLGQVESPGSPPFPSSSTARRRR